MDEEVKNIEIKEVEIKEAEKREIVEDRIPESPEEAPKPKRRGGRRKPTLSVEERIARGPIPESERKKPRGRKKKVEEEKVVEEKPRLDMVTFVRDHAMAMRQRKRERLYGVEAAKPPLVHPNLYNGQLTEIACIHIYDDEIIPLSVEFNLDVEIRKSRKKPTIIGEVDFGRY